MSAQNSSKEWNAEHAAQALQLERSVVAHKNPMLILKFPDPELNKDIIKGFSSSIENVHFQQPSTPRYFRFFSMLVLFIYCILFRYCFVQLKPDADLAKVKEELSQITFGTGKIIAEYKNSSSISHDVGKCKQMFFHI